MTKKDKGPARPKPVPKPKSRAGSGRKRAAGEGAVTLRADGRWMGRLRLRDAATGKLERLSVYGRTQSEVVSRLEELRQRRRTNPKTLLSRDTLGAYLDRWLADDVAVNKAGKTFEEYELALRLYVRPWLAAEKLATLDGEKLVAWQAQLSRDGASANTRLRSIRVLRNALNKAVKLRLLPFNPCVALDKPKVVREERRPLEPPECVALMNVCRDHRLGDLIILAAMTGLRKGELFALEWSAVNLAEGVLVVRRSLEESGGGRKVKEPKTAAGRRVVSLGSEAIAALQRRLDKATEEGMDPQLVPIVFPNTLGGYLRGSNFDRKVWYPLRQAAGIPDTFVFHDLRHTQASLMLAAGVDLKIIQKRLGHRDFATTANIYSHLLQNAQSEAVDKVDQLLRAETRHS
ncbi:MAG TPA: hypothetical protein DC058_09525 [Planctomycetaceae bacterium]|jgi:integrase|nr:hypothetical protein [Planctomycetaceae bacterium]